MKKLLVSIFMLLPFALFAQEVKIAVVNTNEIIVLMPEVAEMEKQIADLNAQYQKEFQVMEDEYTKKYSEYIAQQDSLTENIKLRRQQDIQGLQTRIQNYVPVAQQEIEKRQEALLAPIQEKLQNAIKAVGEERGYTYIFNPQALLYRSDNAIDATPFVKEKLGIK
ncbi:MAG: OmpH family outer membrane protein [Tannerella sp.]|jgi:outer membrane protein|nr:OmpH family outer membrane protein [Tannerella sp.]